jgi:hypothetical protein
MSSARKKVWVVGLLAIPLLAGVWGFLQVVPAGLRLRSLEPYFFWSRDLGVFPSPGGTNEVRVVVNDAGAMHSGNHWIWVVKSPAGSRQRIVAEGYVLYDETSRETLPLRWVSENEIEVSFRTGRRASGRATWICTVP